MVTYAASKSDKEPRIDELLASIQQILAEDPLSSRHERKRGQTKEFRGVAKPSRPPLVFRPPAPVKAEPTARPPRNVALEELLAPDDLSSNASSKAVAVATRGRAFAGAVAAANPVPPKPRPPDSSAQASADTAGADIAQRPVAAAVDVARGPVRDPAAAADVVVVTTPVQVVVTVPEAERKAAAAALDALAHGLAAVASPCPATPAEIDLPVMRQAAEAGPVSTVANGEPVVSAADKAAAVEAVSDESAAIGGEVTASEPAADSVSVTPAHEGAIGEVAARVPEESDRIVKDEAVAKPNGPMAAMPASFDDTVAALLRPMLREWLDANLPRMVEKALTAELSERGLAVPTPGTAAG